jgi:N6-L-threonylcarbamoyladenine synthase
MYILGIETSCDETAASVVDDQKNILSNVVLSQLDEHRVYGGVVPEIAARSHLSEMDNVVKAAMNDAGIGFSDLTAVAATSGPGLIGGVLVGMMTGKAISAAHDIPFLAINHLEAHALTPRLTDDVPFPYLLLLVSGGHTQILRVNGVGSYELWGKTLDDACGECFDKSAKMMGLPYPGGPNLEKIATECSDTKRALERFPLPMPMKGKKNLDYSFSGLKTAVRTHIQAMQGDTLSREDIADLSCAFEYAICGTIEDRVKRAMERFCEETTHDKEHSFVIAGGVAANKMIRERLTKLAEQYSMRFCAPPIGLCSDNGAMIAWAGIERFKEGFKDDLSFKARPRWPLDETGS